jgi:hypothetical protein
MGRIYTCAVVQGNIRYGTEQVITCLTKHFDRVILSTWDDEDPSKIPKGNFDLVQSSKPAVPGFTHRNFQRCGTAAGLRKAAELGATHVLKWRTDMLPTKLDVSQLLAWSKQEIPPGLDSRLVTCAFRNLSVTQDWFSTIPDLFAFADIRLMKLLWDDIEFDYSRSMNIPYDMEEECGLAWCERPDAEGLYCPEAELYANFRNRLQNVIHVRLNHVEIAKKFMRLIDHRRLGICWFGNNGNFRSILQAVQHPWWTEKIWRYKDPVLADPGYLEQGWAQKLRRKHLARLLIKYEIKLQKRWYAAYRVNELQSEK